MENNLNFASDCVAENVAVQYLVLENAHRKRTDAASNYDELIEKNHNLMLEYQQQIKDHSVTLVPMTLAKIEKIKENIVIAIECKENLMMTVKTLQLNERQARSRFFEKIADMEEKLEKTIKQFSGTAMETEIMKTTAEMNKLHEVLMQLKKDYDGINDTVESLNDYRLNELSYEMIDIKKISNIKMLEQKKSNINLLEFEICTMEETLNNNSS